MHNKEEHSKNHKEEKQQPQEEQNKKETQAEATLSEADKLAELNDKYLRLYAEFDNYRKRTANERIELIKSACKELIEALLPVLDSFEHSRAIFEKTSSNTEDLIKGFALIHKQFEDILLKFGVRKIDAVGQAFDPNLHEAVMQKEVPGTASGTVLEILQAGYTLNNKLLRPAMVIVAK